LELDQEKETRLWAWMLFNSTLPTPRTKTLLERLNRENRPLSDLLPQLPAAAAALGLTQEETTLLRAAPATLPARPALRWNEPTYPARLQQLPVKLRPALLFYRGPIAALIQPIIYLPPADLDEEESERTREALSQLLGENLLPAAFQGSGPAALLLEEMADTEGQALLFARCGIDQLELTAEENALLDEGRLLILSPLPPTAAANPAWQSVLEQIAAGMSARLLLSNASQVPVAVSQPETPGLWLTPEPQGSLPANLHTAEDPAEISLWVNDLAVTTPAVTAAPAAAPSPVETDLPEAAPLPPLPPQETLRTLAGGGAIPEVLRQRILKGRPSNNE